MSGTSFPANFSARIAHAVAVDERTSIAPIIPSKVDDDVRWIDQRKMTKMALVEGNLLGAHAAFLIRED